MRYNVYRNFAFLSKNCIAENLELKAALQQAEYAVAKEKLDDDGLGQNVRSQDYPPKSYQTIIETMTAEAGWVTTIISVELIEEKELAEKELAEKELTEEEKIVDKIEIKNTNGYCDTCGDMYTKGYESHHPGCKTTSGITFGSIVLTTPKKVFIVWERVYNNRGDFSSNLQLVFYDAAEANKASALLQKARISTLVEYIVSEREAWDTADNWFAADEQRKAEAERQKLRGKLAALEKEASQIRQLLEGAN